MAANARPAPEMKPQSAYHSMTGLLGEWIRQGTEGFVAGQKILLDLAAQQNALALNIIRERVGLSRPSAKKWADFAGKSVKTLLDVQRNVLDLVVRQNSILESSIKPRLPYAPIRGFAEVFHKGLDNFVEAQKQFLNTVQVQTEGVVGDIEEGKTPELSRLVTVARGGMTTFLESQKKFLDIVQEQVTAETAEGEEAGPALDLLDMIKQSVDAIIETQQQLLDLASEQVKASVSFAGEVFSFDAEPTAFSEVVKKSVDSFVAAQKALVELASKPRGGEETAEEAGHAAA